MFLPRGIPHGYTITSDEVRLLGISTPSDFGDNIERTGTPAYPPIAIGQPTPRPPATT